MGGKANLRENTGGEKCLELIVEGEPHQKGSYQRARPIEKQNFRARPPKRNNTGGEAHLKEDGWRVSPSKRKILRARPI